MLSRVLLPVVLLALLAGCSPFPEGETVVIPAAGGELELSETITLIVPAGAVPEDATVIFQPLDAADLVALYPHRGLTAADVLACFNFPENHIDFASPVTVRITDIQDVPDALPIVHHFDTDSGAYFPYEAEYRYRSATGIMEIDLPHFTGVSVEIQRQARDLVGPDDPCRENYDVKQSDEDFQCDSGGCQIAESALTITFPECTSGGGPLVESAIFREVGPGCEPTMELSALPSEIDPGASASVTATVKLGCKPLEGQTVSFDVTGLGTLSSNSQQTDAEGECSVTFTAGDETGTATVLASSIVSWYTSEIIASGSAGEEVSRGPEKEETAEGSAAITIANTEPWSGSLTMTYAPASYAHPLTYDNYGNTIFSDVYSWSGGTVAVSFTFNPGSAEYQNDGNYWIEGSGIGQITGCNFSETDTSFEWDNRDGDGDGEYCTLDLTFDYEVENTGTFPAIIAFVSPDAVNYSLMVSTTLDSFNSWSIWADEFLDFKDGTFYQVVIPHDPPRSDSSWNDIFWIGDGVQAFPIEAGTIARNFTNSSEPYASLEPPLYIDFIDPMAEPTHSFVLTLTPPE